MTPRILKTYGPILAALLLLVVYWPSMNGLPIWDDLYFLFLWNVTAGEFSYLTILKDFAWPVSVSLDRFLFQIFGHNYFWHHLLNVLVHGLNGWLLFELVKKLKLPYAGWIAALFLFHPANVISVSWIIQLKTLICFTFAILSLHSLLWAPKRKYWYGLSCLFFALSIFSKSASMPLLLIIVVLINHQRRVWKDLFWVLPFLLISSFSTYKVLQSSVTTLSLKQFKSKDFVVNNTEQIVKKDLNEVPKTMIVEESKPGTWDMLLSTNFYYFWQFMLPLEHVPVRGRLQKTAGVLEYVHLAFISVLLLLSWKLPLRNYLLASLIMLTPFMGLIPATYMNITWVSDQHLYLALPFFLIFFLGLLEKMKYRKKEVLPFIALIGFMIVSFRATGLYENEIVFYESSLKSDPTNLPLYYNLATTHQRAGDTKKAYRTLELVIELAEDEPLIAGSKYLPYIKQLRNELLNQARN